jgi:WD40 repeat protein
MTVAGQRIAAVCGDDTVNVYDAVTGVLRLTLNAPQRVMNVAGSPDGSILFCGHQLCHDISLWDMQTGGLIHTFTTKSETSDIVVSSTGRYLGSCSFDGAFEFWDVESRCEGSGFWANRVMCACWLEPEDHVALGFRKTVGVLEITTRRTLHTFSMAAGRARDTIPVDECIEWIAYSAGQHRLAVYLISRNQGAIVVIDIRTGLASVSYPWGDQLPAMVSFAFSDNGDRVVCASGTNDIRFFDATVPRARWHNYPSRLGLIDSISFLRNGHLVVNTKDSIQLLAMEYAQPLDTSLDTEVSRVCPLDSGRAICAYSGDYNNVYLLDTETMRTLATYHIGPSNLDPLYPSLVIGSVIFPWEFPPFLPTLDAISPDRKTSLTVKRYGASQREISARRLSGIHTLGSLIQGGEPPRNIGFTSNAQFYVEHGIKDDDKEALALTAASATSEARFHTKDRRVDRCIRITFALTPSFGILELERSVPPASQYALDKGLEWVVDAKSRRVCWLPPGYVSGIDDGYFFVGSSIVMAGRDGILRKLTFREPRSDS